MVSIRDEIARLCAEHDKLMTEDARAATTAPPAQKSDDDNLVLRE